MKFQIAAAAGIIWFLTQAESTKGNDKPTNGVSITFSGHPINSTNGTFAPSTPASAPNVLGMTQQFTNGVSISITGHPINSSTGDFAPVTKASVPNVLDTTQPLA